MTLDANNETSTHDEDINTTAPQAKPEIWSMPEPVFRKTSGKLPSGFAQAIEFETVERSMPVENESSDSDAESLTSTPPEPRPKSPTLKIVVVALALAAMITFIAVFLTLLYFFFMR